LERARVVAVFIEATDGLELRIDVTARRRRAEELILQLIDAIASEAGDTAAERREKQQFRRTHR
jgi:hypothetical protein